MEEPADIYTDLRSRALSAEPGDIGLAPTPELPNVWGALMDMAYPQGSATLLGLADGTTSLYTSSGGGVIGGGEHPAVVEATTRWLRVADDVLAALEPADESPLHDAGHIAFTVLGYRGRYRAAEAEAALEAGSSPLTPLFAAGHDVITELRQIEERGR